MKIFLSYGHDSNEPLIEMKKDYLSKVAEGNLKQGKRMKFLKITTILTKLPKLLTGVSALD